MNSNKVETRLREIAERAEHIEKEWDEGCCPSCTKVLSLNEGCEPIGVCNVCAQTLAQDVPWLLELIKKQREALEADALADKLFERAEAHREESIACGYDNDPTGSLAVTESYKAANAQALIATQLKRDALNFSPENL